MLATQAERFNDLNKFSPNGYFIHEIEVAHKLYIIDPTKYSNRHASILIEYGTRDSPVIRETLNILAHVYGQELDEAFVTDFSRSNKLEDAFRVKEDKDGRGKYLSVRDGLIEIRKAVDVPFPLITITVPQEVLFSKATMRALSILALDMTKIPHSSPVTTVAERLFNIWGSVGELCSIEAPRIPTYKNFGLIEAMESFTTSIKDYCFRAHLSDEECDQFRRLMEKL